MHKIILLALIAITFAGCSEEAPAETTTDGPTGKDVETKKGLGAISGVVVSETIMPIAGATVSITGGSQQVTTDEGGLFIFPDVSPGTYFLEITADRYVGSQTSVEVEAGEVAKPRILLKADTSPIPYKVTHPHTGFMQAWGGIGHFFLTALAPEAAACDCSLHFEPDPNPVEYIYEVIWEDNAPAPHLGYYYELDQTLPEYGEGISRYGESPIYYVVDASMFGEQEEMRARFTGPDEGVTIDQSFDLFVTVWYVGAAPEGWSAIGTEA